MYAACEYKVIGKVQGKTTPFNLES